jgi:peptidoglycan/xylan/chitin deacetylase (PgdA/CDA1 family)
MAGRGKPKPSANPVARSRLGPPRDFAGYGAAPPDPRWPGGARVALNLCLNLEAGGERTILDGDAHSEDLLNDTGFPAYPGLRAPLVESIFEYGPRVGVWRVLRIFEKFEVRASMWAVASGAQRYPEIIRACMAQGHEIVSHGWRWIDYTGVNEKTEREHIRLATQALKSLTGEAPVGWMTGRPSINTRRLLVEAGGYLYDRDALNDELPYWTKVEGRQHLVVPTSFETNDNRFDRNLAFAHADDFARYLTDAFDLLYEEGAEHPKMMTVALHDRLIGRPGRAAGLVRFLDHVRRHDRVWIATGREIAEHWRAVHPAKKG